MRVDALAGNNVRLIWLLQLLLAALADGRHHRVDAVSEDFVLFPWLCVWVHHLLLPLRSILNGLLNRLDSCHRLLAVLLNRRVHAVASLPLLRLCWSPACVGSMAGTFGLVVVAEFDDLVWLPILGYGYGYA